MEKKIRIILFVISVFAVWACVPVPVQVDTTSPGYQGTYGYGYGDQPGYDEYGYGYDDYVDVPIEYGEPVYYTPPISVTFAFDYFTYEVDNGFVDVVFWKGGHRYHREPWYDQGRRISSQDIRSSRRNYRVRGPEFFDHRRKLEQQHRIAHPDTYYKLERRKQKEKQREQSDRFRHDQERQKRLLEQQQREQDKQRILIDQKQELERQRYMLDLQRQEQEGTKRYIEMQQREREDYQRSLKQKEIEQEKQKRLFEQQQREPATMRQKDDRLRQEQELREQKYRLKEQEERNKLDMKKRSQEEKLRQKDQRYKQEQEKREQKQKEKKMKEHLKKDDKRKLDGNEINPHIPPIY